MSGPKERAGAKQYTFPKQRKGECSKEITENLPKRWSKAKINE